ncbi:nuclear transport factor 2 family protein [Parasphingopyxis sp.]|uniref:nuclear transport factor 2 family protein n=1 Tax=Parasphingopyxis sp. TaxID=1920299 RepID=UPI0026232D05|nr:nuclear transport factor 2 family protein [Parasphingopyxis sp.]
MNNVSPVAIAKGVFRAYADDDREAIEKLIAPNFRFMSPYDNGLDRETYLARCWPTHKNVKDYRFPRAIEIGAEVMVTYELEMHDGRTFRNTEILTVENGQLVAAEVYFGWNIPHDAPEGGFKDAI